MFRAEYSIVKVIKERITKYTVTVIFGYLNFKKALMIETQLKIFVSSGLFEYENNHAIYLEIPLTSKILQRFIT